MRKLLLIAHSKSRDGRVVPQLEARGYAVEWRCPAEGDRLPKACSGFAGAIVFGGVQSANDAPDTPYLQHEIEFIRETVESGRPYLGICLGGQLLARALGARVARHPEGFLEVGYFPVRPTAEGRGLFPAPMHVYHWHREGFDLPQGAELLATGDRFPNQAFRYGERAYGLQFHPEVTPAVARRWLASANGDLEKPGAQSAEAQITAMELYDAPMHQWMDRFLDHWLRGNE